jgi:hypothetical protein
MYLLAESTSHTYYRLSRLQAMSEWWHWLLLAGLCVLIFTYVIGIYWRDGVDLSRGVRWSLVGLRLCALVGILFFFLDLEKRTEDREIKPSRALLLVDTSQSMALRDTADSAASSAGSRIEQVVAEMRDGEMLRQLRSQHDVAVYQFSDQLEPAQVAFFSRLKSANTTTQGEEELTAEKAAHIRTARWTVAAAAVLAGIAVLLMLVYFGLARWTSARDAVSLVLLLGMVLLIASAVVLAVATLRAPDLSWRVLAGWEEPDLTTLVRADKNSSPATEPEVAPASEEPSDVRWQELLDARGTATRLGDALRTLVQKERGGSIAGIVVVTDGGNNTGADCDLSARLAQAAGIPLFAVGLGSDQQPMNARVVDLEAPKRVFPGDKFTLTGYLQAYGMRGRSVNVRLLSTAPDLAVKNDQELQELGDKATIEEERSVSLGEDGAMMSLQFEVTPEEVGARQFVLQVLPGSNDLESGDNLKTARVTIIERKSRVLLIAGGPSREYSFLRNQLFRDRDVTLDVYLQSSVPGASQEAATILTEFPDLAEDMFQYDCVVAFDPDWTKLNEVQVELLDRWVAEQAGGLIVVAGPVFTPEWAGIRRGRDTRIDTIRALYPVVFFSQGSPSLSSERFGGTTAWPLNFTRDGLSSEFLWLEDNATDSEAAWSSFEGVFGYYSVKDPKPGARVLARFSNPDTAIDGELPIYAAAHFYGAGRVFFQASGEMWRLRAVEPRYFETYYTKLVRWVSQGRLLRDSSRGVLLVDKDRCLLGDLITARAVLNNAQHQALTVDSVTGNLTLPDGQSQPLTLRKVQDAPREGLYEGQFTTLQEGDYRLALTPPDGSSDELLVAEVRVRMPALEIERPQRNDELLKSITQTTGGSYFIGFDAAMNRRGSNRASLPTILQPNDQIIYLPESVDRLFDERLMGWLLTLIAGTLCLEWLVRRLSRLA